MEMPFNFPVRPRTGAELRKIYQAISPFESDGSLKPEGKLVTLLASNSNYPNALETESFVQASAKGEGSPQIIQYSYTSTANEGLDPKKMGLKERFTDIRPCGFGAWMSNLLLSSYASFHNADMMFMALDHFTSPKITEVEFDAISSGSLEYEIARDRIVHAAGLIADLETGDLDGKTLDDYAKYMISSEYQSFRKDFLAAVRFGNPAWAMIDTGALPLALNFATSKDLTAAVRNELNNHDVMLEAEISATGQSGDKESYVYWKDMDESAREKERLLVRKFVAYTLADAIAYEIGMEHAAKAGESHEPDEDKLHDVQKVLFEIFKRHIPFAQHGGTGSKRIVRGVVGKYNVNTQYLFAGAIAEADRYEKFKEQIRARQKKAIGTDRFLEEIARVSEVCSDYLKQTGSYGLSPMFREILGTQKQNLPLYKAFEVNATE